MGCATPGRRVAPDLPFPHLEAPSTASVASFGSTSTAMPRIKFQAAAAADPTPDARVARAAAGLMPAGFALDPFQWKRGEGPSVALHGPGPALVVVEGGEVTLRRRQGPRRPRRRLPLKFQPYRGAVLHTGAACVVPPTWEVVSVLGRPYHVAVAAVHPD